MADDNNINEQGAQTPSSAPETPATPETAAAPAAPETPAAPVAAEAPAAAYSAPQPAASQMPPIPQPQATQQMPPQPSYQAPAPQPQPFYPPAPLMHLTGGMKFGWFVVGALLGIPGILVAWLTSADKLPQVKSETIKWSVIGCVVWIVLGFIFSMMIGGLITAAIAGAVGSMDPSYYSYGHGTW